jgi:hypothetical protein
MTNTECPFRRGLLAAYEPVEFSGPAVSARENFDLNAAYSVKLIVCGQGGRRTAGLKVGYAEQSRVACVSSERWPGPICTTLAVPRHGTRAS